MRKKKKNIVLVYDRTEAVEQLSCWSRELVPSAEVSRLCVRKDMQKQGIAKEMMKYVFEILKKEGKKRSPYFGKNRPRSSIIII